MAKLKHTPKTFTEAREILQDRDSVKLGNNTWLEKATHFILEGLGEVAETEDYIAVRLHNTQIVKFYADNPTTLHTGGWRTVTTKDRINEFIKGSVYQRDYTWYYAKPLSNGYSDWDNAVEFEEGMEVL